MADNGTKYIYRKKHNGDLVQCDSCRSRAPLAIVRILEPPYTDHKMFCMICDSTIVGRATQSPDKYKEPDHLVCMAQIANLLLDNCTNRCLHIINAEYYPPE